MTFFRSWMTLRSQRTNYWSFRANWIKRGSPIWYSGFQAAGAEVVVQQPRGLAELRRGHVVDRATEVRWLRMLPGDTRSEF
jgi:hypothetical protein